MAFNFLITGLSSMDIMVNSPKHSSISSLTNNLSCQDTEHYMFVHNGSPIEDVTLPLELTPLEEQSRLIVIRAYRQVLGGKGGFGALIRAMGMRMNRNRNKDACRDLTGRRLRAVNAEKKVAELMKKEPERRKKEAKEKQEKRRLLLEGPRHQFNDTEYIEQLEATQDSLEDAVKQGLMAGGGQSSTEGHSGIVMGKRKGINNNGEQSNKKRKIWHDDEMISDDCDSDISDSEDDENKKLGNSSSPDIPILSVPVIHEDTPVINDSSTPGIPILPVPEVHEDTPVINDGSTSSSTVNHEDDPVINTNPSPKVQSHHIPSNSPTVITNIDAVITKGSGDGMPTDDSNINPSVTPFSYEEFDLNGYETMEQLMEIGGGNLKTVLQRIGLKCGGTPQERAVRLWSVKGKDINDIDPSLLASNKRSRNKGKKK